jgi:hypothetical protein
MRNGNHSSGVAVMAESNGWLSGYRSFLDQKTHLNCGNGFAPVWMPDFLFDFQQYLVDWAVRRERGAMFADTGLGKTPMQLTWAENIIRKTNGRVLIITPLAVGQQTAEEAEKFGIEAKVSRDGQAHPGISITNYERLHLFDRSEFTGVVCDESSAIKSFKGKHRAQVTDFMRKMPYRLLATATAAPNDYIELGTSSEALGELGATDMMNRFFKNDENNSGTGRVYGKGRQWRFRGHSEQPFWKWVSSWARAMRNPSDYGFSDEKFILPPLTEEYHLVKARTVKPGFLFEMPARGLDEEREEARRTIKERCEKVAELANTGKPVVVWCNLNPEGDLLAKLLPDLVQVKGSTSLDAKEEAYTAFRRGQIRGLIIKPKIGAWGMNWQHCAHAVVFPTHSYEQLYQLERRFWRFGQSQPVQVDFVVTESGQEIMTNLQRKAAQADRMFTSLVAHMNHAMKIDKSLQFTQSAEVPAWLK